MPAEPDLIDEVLAAPAGVALLEALESSCRADLGLFELIETSDPDAVDRATEPVLTPEGQLQSNRAFVRGLGSHHGMARIRRAVGWCALAGVAACAIAVALST